MPPGDASRAVTLYTSSGTDETAQRSDAVAIAGMKPFAVIGVENFGLSILWEVWTTGKQVPGYPSLVIGLMTIGGVQLIMIGIVGEYIGKILSELKARPIYFVAEHTVKSAAKPFQQLRFLYFLGQQEDPPTSFWRFSSNPGLARIERRKWRPG